MPSIRIQPLGVCLEAEVGASVMEAARAQGYYWPTTCGGEGHCTSCTMSVLQGPGSLSEMGRSEFDILSRERNPARLKTGEIRLACQARIYGDIEVHKPGVRRNQA